MCDQRQDRRRRLGDRYRQEAGSSATPGRPHRSSTFVMPVGCSTALLHAVDPNPDRGRPRLWWRGSWSPPPARRPVRDRPGKSSGVLDIVEHHQPMPVRGYPVQMLHNPLGVSSSGDAPPPPRLPTRQPRPRPADRLLPRGSVDHATTASPQACSCAERGRQLGLATPHPLHRAHGHRLNPDNAARNVAISSPIHEQAANLGRSPPGPPAHSPAVVRSVAETPGRSDGSSPVPCSDDDHGLASRDHHLRVA